MFFTFLRITSLYVLIGWAHTKIVYRRCSVKGAVRLLHFFFHCIYVQLTQYSEYSVINILKYI